MANKQWRKNQGKDPYFRRAKEEGYRARSAYKLLEINERFRVIRPADHVLDIGAAPGSWSQVASQLVGARGRVVAVDLQPMETLPGVTILTGDVREPAVRAAIEAALGGEINTVISDIAPSTTGVAVTDHARSIELSVTALAIAIQALRRGGNFVTKVFAGPEYEQFLQLTKRYFRRAATFDPDATRRESKERFVVANGLVARAALDPAYEVAELLKVAPERIESERRDE